MTSTREAMAEGRRVVPERPSWDSYFMSFAKLARTRASCIRRQVGAVIVKNRMVLTTGYNGAPRGLAHAAEVGCLRDQLGVPSGQRHELCRGLHAEQNAIIQAARHGISIEGAEMYCTTHPCVICIKMIINAGLTYVYYLEGYADEISRRIIEESGFPVIQISETTLTTPVVVGRVEVQAEAVRQHPATTTTTTTATTTTTPAAAASQSGCACSGAEAPRAALRVL